MSRTAWNWLSPHLDAARHELHTDRVLSDNDSIQASGAMTHDMKHVHGAPCHPQPQAQDRAAACYTKAKPLKSRTR
jgi:hypothetical protein